MDATHPLTRYLAVWITPSCTRNISVITSPHAGFSTWTVTSGDSIRPEFRGCSKWSSNRGEYIGNRSGPDRRRFLQLGFQPVTSSTHPILRSYYVHFC